MNHKIHKEFMLHKGGTKFYQILEVTAQVGRGSIKMATVTHWGTYKGGGMRRIVEGGQTQVLPGVSGFTKRQERLKRGYETPRTGGVLENCALNDAELADYLITELGATEANRVMQCLDLMPGPRTASTAPHKKPAEPAPDEPDERPEGWGAF